MSALKEQMNEKKLLKAMTSRKTTTKLYKGTTPLTKIHQESIKYKFPKLYTIYFIYLIIYGLVSKAK